MVFENKGVADSGNKNNIKKVIAGLAVTNIDDEAFKDLSELEYVPNVTSVGASAFKGTGLTTVDMPS